MTKDLSAMVTTLAKGKEFSSIFIIVKASFIVRSRHSLMVRFSIFIASFLAGTEMIFFKEIIFHLLCIKTFLPEKMA
jgi:hypothetical protein